MIETIGAGTACLQLGLELLHSLGRRIQLMLEILSRSRGGFERRFEEAQDLRLSLDDRSGEITDFINWYQANEAQAEPVPAAVSARPPSEAVSRRNDAITRFLDSVEQRGW
jgi:hypothetical protein